MNAVEFQAVAKDGHIELPPGHAERVKGPVRVIVLYEPRPEADDRDGLDELMEHPILVPGFVPLTREEAHDRR